MMDYSRQRQKEDPQKSTLILIRGGTSHVPSQAKKVLLSKEKIGQRIRVLRERKGWSQGKLAEVLEAHPQNISQIERGVRGVSLQQVVRLARVLDVSTDEILGRRERTNGVGIDRRLMRRLRRIQELPSSRRDALLKMIDGALDMTQ
jgi:transcriptional regulator with XRE-family HTH domain